MSPLSALSKQRYPALGLVFVAAALGFVVFCVASYNAAFTPRAMVELKMQSAGLQLLPGSDVKLRGINVGTVDDISSDGSSGKLRLAINPKRLPDLPADVTARLVPKTLFGEKYVDLLMPDDTDGQRLQAGDTITEDRSKATLEINRVLDDVLPLLRAVRPEDLSRTLTALATALDGRGEQLGQTLEQLDGYLKKINPQLPQLRKDMSLLADVTAEYDKAAPELLTTLRNLTTTSATVVAKKDQLSSFLSEVTGAADNTRGLLQDAGQDVIDVNSVNRDVIKILKKYSPVFPCFFRGFAVLQPRIDNSVGNTPETKNFAHIVIEFTGQSSPVYKYPDNLPEYNDYSDPNCHGLPNPPEPMPKKLFKDGTEDDPRFSTEPPPADPDSVIGTLPTAMRGGLVAGGPVDAILAPAMGVRASEVPAVAGLLWSPLLSGAKVSLS